MAAPINRNMNFAFEDLSKVKLGDEKNSLDFSFVEAREVSARPEDSWDVWATAQRPDVIIFSGNLKLINKINEIIESKNRIKCYQSSIPGFYELSAKKFKVFFKAIQSLQKKKFPICIPTNLFQKTLDSLSKYNYVTDSDIEKLQKNLRTDLTLEEYENGARAFCSVEKALSLAYYYRNKSSEKSLYWLIEAKKYLKKISLRELIDLDEFFLNFTTINYGYLYHEPPQEIVTEIVEAIVRCPTIKTMDSSLHTHYDLKFAQSIGSFLAKAIYIETAYLFSNFFKESLDSKTVAPIAEALSVNSSIKIFRLENQRISDEGIIKIINAIESNPNSKITSLSFIDCKISDVGAVKLLEFCKRMDQITDIDISTNKISDQVLFEFDHVLSSRVNLTSTNP